MLATRPLWRVRRLVDSLSPNAIAALPYLFDFWAHAAHQLPPAGAWSTWVLLGGRGSGKTRAGAEWIRSMVEGATPLAPGKAHRVALLAETWEQGRDVMVFGESGIMACTPPDRRPTFVSTRHRLIWPNGATAQLFSATDPESLRGPQFDCAWSDELAKWRKGREAWDMLQFGLRLGADPRQVVTTTPRDTPLLHDILGDAATVVTQASTWVNRAYLADDFLDKITKRYQGTDRGRQELDGELLVEAAGALFTRRMIDAARVRATPALDRIVVGVDPPVTSGPASDECGIVVAGIAGEVAYVLADRSLGQAAPAVWAQRVVEAWRAHDADRIVAEVNQGGDLVVELIRRIDSAAPVTAVRAARGKSARAEPVSLLYAQGRVRHVGVFKTLEDQMCAFAPGGASPDRLDALVWAVSDLMRAPGRQPRVRSL